MRRRNLLLSAAGASVPAMPALSNLPSRQPGANGNAAKVLRYAFPVAETGFDPAQIIDIYSRTVTAHIFESPLTYDHLARPFKLRLMTAAAMPQMSDDFKTWTVSIRPGIYFADDAAFKGKKRELTAADYVYSWKRFFDPRVKAPYVAVYTLFRLLGMNEYRNEVLKTKQPFDYDKPIEGLQALDRYTLQFRMAEPEPRFLYSLCNPDIGGAVAREVVETYGDDIMQHPVGTGPFKLSEWRRSSLITLVRNESYREVLYDAEPNADDAEGQAVAKLLKGRRLPLVDRVEVSIIEEQQPRYLSFLNQQHDVLERLPNEFINITAPNGQLAPRLARQGVQIERVLASDITMTVFNMSHPVIGGDAPDRVALRRAINLALDMDKEIRLVRRGQAIAAQSVAMPNTYGYSASFRSENGEFNRARAKALLDTFGYVDRDGDGWRERPDGEPLVLEWATQPEQVSRQLNEVWRSDLNAVGLRVDFRPAKWPENLKNARAGKLMIWGVGLSATSPDGQGAFARGYSPEIGGQNLARFKSPEFDRIYERMKKIPDGPERLALFREAKRLLTVQAPYKFHTHRIITDLSHSWVVGYRRPVFWQEWWHVVDIEPSGRANKVG
jgi:ABC-type transport system substrate-binding protein